MSEFDTVVLLLLPHCETDAQRCMLLISAFNAYPTLLTKVDYSGTAAEFVTRLVHMLQTHGEVEPGQQALWHLLRTLKNFVGIDQQAQIEALAGYANSALPPSLIEQSLHAETTKSILISYSRRDREAVLTLYADLKALGFSLWRDLHDIQGGEPFWEEIKKGIDACESLVLCMSPDALNSQFVQAEWHYAREQGKRVVPVVVADVDFATVPRWMSRLDWKDFRPGKPERETVWASFIKTLNTPYTGRKVPFMVQPLPPYFVERPTEFEQIVNALVDQQGAVAITAAVKGAGGFGKTTLAMALCHDNRIKGAFDDGILWVTLGETPTEADLLKKALDLVFELTGSRPPVESREAARAELTKAIGDRYILLVLDDLWRKADADLFLTGTKHSATLITTRLDGQLPDETRFKQTVDAMNLEQAVQLLTWGMKGVAAEHQKALEALARRLGEWAVLLRLVNGTLRKRLQNGEALGKALIYINDALTIEGFQAFSTKNSQERSAAVHSTINVSLTLLRADEQAQFRHLAIFPEDVDIPFTTLEKLWRLTGYFTEKVASSLNDVGLLLNFELEQRTIRLHDVVRTYLRDTHRATLSHWQADFIKSLDLHALPDAYAYRFIAYHLREAGQEAALRRLLLDFNFLYAKLNATDANALLGDFVGLTNDEPLRLIESALSMSMHVISQDKTQLAVQLYGRLMGRQDKQSDLSSLLQAATVQQRHFHLLHPTLSRAGGALIRRIPLEHNGQALALMDDGDHLVVADGHQLKVFMWRTGTLLTTFTQHAEWVYAVSVQGELAFSASEDQTVKVWRWATGEVLTTFTQHTDRVTGVSVQGELAFSASHDGTVKVWYWATGKLLTTFSQHTAEVNGVSVQGELAFSASDDGTVKVWRWGTGKVVTNFMQHIFFVNTVSVQGELVFSASEDNTIKVWRWATGELLTNFTQHRDWVNGVSVNGELAFSASRDRTVKVWYWATGELLTTFTQHTSYVTSVSVQGELIFSTSDDRTVKVWYWDTGHVLTTFTQHTDRVNGVRIQGELAFSASRDQTVKAWRWRTGEMVATFTTDAPLTCIAFEPAERILLAGDSLGQVHVLRVVGLDHLLFPDGEE